MSSLLQRQLCARSAFLEPLIEAIECKELDISIGISQCPSLIPLAMESWERNEAHNVKFQRTQLKMVQMLEAHGCDPWVEANNLNLLTLAYRAHNPLLLAWAATHPQAPPNQVHDFFFKQQRSTLFGVDANMIDALVAIGAAADATDEKGNTPLHLARNTGQVASLLKAGVDGYALNEEGLDARDSWDLAKIDIEQRNAMERELANHFPMRAEKIIRQFGAQIYKQGSARTKARLKEAKVDATTAQWRGLNLIELLTCEALDDIRDEKGDKKDYSGRQGERWRKAFDTTLKMMSARNATFVDPARVQAATELFMGFAQPSPMRAWAPGAIMESADHPASKLTNHPIARRIDHCLELIERAVEMGVLRDGSHVAANLASRHIATLSRAEWAVQDASGESRLLHLLDLATRGLWDTHWSIAPADAYSPLSRLALDVDLVAGMMDRPHGVGIVLLAQTRTKTDVLDGFGTRIVLQLKDRGMDQFALSHEDPRLAAALVELGKSMQAVLRKIGKALDMEAQRQDLDRQTTPGRGVGRAVRL
jgi:hypothetical protein